MSAALHHRILPDGNVHLRLRPTQGGEAMAVVDPRWLKAKLWGMLADLDPEGVIEAALGNRNVSPPAMVLKAPLAIRILWTLHDHPKTVGGIRQLLNDTATSISTRCQELCEEGLAERLNSGRGKGFKQIYGITDRGRAALTLAGVRT